jgi:hypothetical protein
MFLIHKQSKPRFDRFIALAIVVSFAWQLGGCPCGCFEHNAWVLMLVSNEHSIEPDQHGEFCPGFACQATGSSASQLLSSEHNHEECAGGRTTYVDNSRSDAVGNILRMLDLGSVSRLVEKRHQSPHLSCSSSAHQLRCPENSFPHCRSALQVYLI